MLFLNEKYGFWIKQLNVARAIKQTENDTKWGYINVTFDLGNLYRRLNYLYGIWYTIEVFWINW